MENKLKTSHILKIIKIIKSCKNLDQLNVIESFVQYKILGRLNIDDYFYIKSAISFKNGEFLRPTNSSVKD